MPLVVDPEFAGSVEAMVAAPSGEVLESWDMRTGAAIPARPLPADWIEVYNRALRPMPGDPVSLASDRALVVLIDGVPAGAVNVKFAGSLSGPPRTKILRIINITSTGAVPRTSVLILAAGQQLVERYASFHPFVAPIAPYFPMMCVLRACGGVPVFNRELLLLGDPEADPDCEDDEHVTDAVYSGTALFWTPRPFARTEIIKEDRYGDIGVFADANTIRPAFPKLWA